jgi:hypothetical protein
MRTTLASIALIAGVAFSLPALAATVESGKGQVLINRGGGFQPVAGGAQAGAGDAVMVSPNGSAQIVYSDGCSIPVVPGNVITVTAESPCKSFAQANQTPDLTPWVIGAIVLGGGATAVILSQKSNTAPSPASP